LEISIRKSLIIKSKETGVKRPIRQDVIDEFEKMRRESIPDIDVLCRKPDLRVQKVID